MLIFITLFILAVILFIMNQFPSAALGIILIPIAYVLGIYSYQKYITWKSGSLGEDIVIKELKKLRTFLGTLDEKKMQARSHLNAFKLKRFTF